MLRQNFTHLIALQSAVFTLYIGYAVVNVVIFTRSVATFRRRLFDTGGPHAQRCARPSSQAFIPLYDIRAALSVMQRILETKIPRYIK